MSVVFGICCWISEASQIPELRRCLESVKDYKVILVDGKWYDVEGERDISLPLAIEMIKQYPNVTLITSINRHEWENRNLYLERCKEGDILIVIDTDEYISGSLDGFVPDSSSFYVNGYSPRHGGGVMLNRGITYPSKTRHRDRHNEYWYDGKKLDFSGAVPPDFTIFEDRLFRSQKIKDIMKKRGRLREFR